MTDEKKPVQPLTDEEIMDIRAFMQDFHRHEWLKQQIKRFFVYMTGTAAGIITLSGAWDAVALWLGKGGK